MGATCVRSVLCALTLLGAVGCASASIDLGHAESGLGELPAAVGIAPGGLDEEGVLLLVNDFEATTSVLTSRTQLTAEEARSIAEFRITADGLSRWFSSLDELGALPNVTEETFRRLLADANASGYVEVPGFDPPSLAVISIPPNLGHPPTSSDVTVEAGFDGKPVVEAAQLVRSRLTNTVYRENEQFVARTIAENHKAFSLAVGNLFAADSPHARFAKSLQAETLTLLGTMSVIHPTILVAETAGAKSYYARGASGGYEAIPVPKYPVMMRAKLRLETGVEGDPGQGVRVFYPAWSAKVLRGPAVVITEGGG